MSKARHCTEAEWDVVVTAGWKYVRLLQAFHEFAQHEALNGPMENLVFAEIALDESGHLDQWLPHSLQRYVKRHSEDIAEKFASAFPKVLRQSTKIPEKYRA